MKKLSILVLLLVVVFVAFGVEIYILWSGDYARAPEQSSFLRNPPNFSIDDVPEGYQQLLPRGGIPAIDDPQYVSAKQAKLSDETYVLGIVVDDQPLAYSLNLLNDHEIVNDTVGSVNFAAVW